MAKKDTATPESGVPMRERVTRALPRFISGRKGDVRLPAEQAGERDPRLPPPTQIERMREGLDVVRGLSKQSRRAEPRGRRSRGRNA